MNKIVIFGNSGSGKSTLAKRLALKNKLAHLDLDTIAWQPTQVPERMSISESEVLIHDFLSIHHGWVIEGCYSDLLALVITQADKIIFLNLPISTCIMNAKNRSWEPHKYQSKEAQDKNLDMLIGWISNYSKRKDTFSKMAHEKIYEEFQGNKAMYISNDHCK